MSFGDVSKAAEEELNHYYDFLYEDRQGYVYAATKELSGHNTSWKQHFFAWPAQRADLVKFTVFNRARKDVYVAPAMFNSMEAIKENVIGTNVIWAEFDESPKTSENVPDPTCRIASGGDGHEHWYWKVDQHLTSDQLDLINRALAYHLDADPSGWDSTQVLRPPNTFNHKRKRETNLVNISKIVLSLALFSNVPNPPAKADVENPTYIPPVEEVIAKYPFPKTVRDLFFSPKPSDRSDALMALGYHCAELGMAKPEILSMLLNADERWGKFKGRDDRMRRLLEIVSIAITKYPSVRASINTVNLKPLGFKTLLATEVNLEWQWDSFLQKNGYFLLTGPTQVGKTQFSLDAAGHIALGKPFLGKETKEAKIGFFSLEMPLTDLKHFVSQMQFSFTLEEQERLEKNLMFFPLGEPLYLGNDNVRAEFEQIVGDLKLDGVIIDSLGSATEESVSDEKIKHFFHWNDTLRQKLNVFTWYIHHHRKANGDNRKPNKIGDVYGSQYITSYATTVACLWDTGVPNLISFITLKKRLAVKDPPFIIQRDERLHFVKATTSDKPSITPGLALGPSEGDSKNWAPSTHPVQSKPSGTHTGAGLQPFVTGDWSIGPSTHAELDKKLEVKKDPNEFTISLNMKVTD